MLERSDGKDRRKIKSYIKLLLQQPNNIINAVTYGKGRLYERLF